MKTKHNSKQRGTSPRIITFTIKEKQDFSDAISLAGPLDTNKITQKRTNRKHSSNRKDGNRPT